MAKSKYFHVKHNGTGAEHIISAPRASAAVSVVGGNRGAVKPASDDDIAAHFQAGGVIHEKSTAEGDGKLFMVHVEPKVLIRAKNAGAAFEALNDGAYTVEPATQDTLVRLLSLGLQVKVYEEPSRAGAAPANAGAPDAQGAQGAQGGDAGQPQVDGQSPDAAAPVAEGEAAAISEAAADAAAGDAAEGTVVTAEAGDVADAGTPVASNDGESNAAAAA